MAKEKKPPKAAYLCCAAPTGPFRRKDEMDRWCRRSRNIEPTDRKGPAWCCNCSGPVVYDIRR